MVSPTKKILLASAGVQLLAFGVAGPEFSKTTGKYELSAALFPYTILMIKSGIGGSAIAKALLVTQFVLYGFFCAWAWHRDRLDNAALWLSATHVTYAVAACWVGKS